MSRHRPPPGATAQIGSSQRLDAEEARRLLLRSVSEKAFQAQVVDMARLLGYRVYHTFDSRRSESGFPDLVLVKPPRLILAEIKREAGALTRAQRGWIAALRQCPGAEVYVWRPTDWEAVEGLLRGERER